MSKEMSNRVTPANTQHRAQRDFQMLRRTTILIMILFISGFPLSAFIFLSFADRAPNYHFRIAYVFLNGSMLLVMIALYQFTDSLQTAMKKLINLRPNTIAGDNDMKKQSENIDHFPVYDFKRDMTKSVISKKKLVLNKHFDVHFS